MKVVATRKGYYGEKRRMEGDVFELTDSEHFSESWMQKASGDDKPAEPHKPAKVQNPQDPRDLNQVVNDALGDKAVLNNGSGIKPVSGGNPPARRGRPPKQQAQQQQSSGDQPAKAHKPSLVEKAKHAVGIGGDDQGGNKNVI